MGFRRLLLLVFLQVVNKYLKMKLRKKLNKLFFYREYVKNTFVVHHVHYTMALKRFLWIRISYIRHFGYDLTVFGSEKEAVEFITVKKAEYREALKYLFK